VENISIIQHWQGCNRKILSSKPTWATKQKPVSKKKKKERKKERKRKNNCNSLLQFKKIFFSEKSNITKII
jgi:hypothetical protein